MNDSENVNTGAPKKWYDNKVIVGLLLFVFPPVGLYALWKSNTISKGWKVGWSIIIGIVFLAAIGSEDEVEVNSKNDSLKSLSQASMKTFFDNTYQTNEHEEKVKKFGKTFSHYSIFSFSGNWTVHTYRTENNNLARIECADIGKKWNSDKLYVCNQVFDLIDKRIMEFADSASTKHKRIDDMLVKNVSTDSSNIIVVDFKTFNPTLEVRDSPRAIYEFNTIEHGLRLIKNTDYLKKHSRNGLILGISGRMRKVFVNQQGWDSLSTEEKLTLVKNSNISIAGWQHDFSSPVYIENNFGKELAVYSNKTNKLKVTANKKSTYKNTSQNYLTDQQKRDYIEDLKRTGLLLSFENNRVSINPSIWDSLSYNELQKVGNILNWWIQFKGGTVDDSDPVFFESDSNTLAVYNNETNSFNLY